MKFFSLFTVVAITSLIASISWADEVHTTKSWRKDAQFQLHKKSGKMRFVGIKNKKKLYVKKGQKFADSISETYGVAFGLADPGKQLKLKKQTQHKDLVTTYRYQQQYKGIPVVGAELVAGMDAQNQLSFISGETALNLSLNVNPVITTYQAKNISLAAAAKWYRERKINLLSNQPELSIFKAEIISPSTMPERVIWKVNVTGENINELVFVDANSGSIIFHINQIHSALNRQTYSANNTSTFQATLICDESNPTCSGGDADAQAAHQYAEDTYDFYFNKHARDGIDGVGGAIISSVHIGPNFNNAAWTGTQMIYGDGFPLADDVVAHELTHGVTQNESNLYYYYQAGAINESFSDLWGEFVDQSNARGNDATSVKWLVGEDIPVIGAIRNMKNPTAFSDPDRITSSNYFTGSLDNGGVHINSGINNKAVYLMTDGGSFNGQDITGIGIDKVAKLYYEVQTKHLTSGSDYLDLYNALTQACSDLVTAATLVSSDCTQVQKALTAVEMNLEPLNGFNPEASLCSIPSTQNSTIFSDDFESGFSKWTFSHDTNLLNKDWTDWLTTSPTAPFATSGVHSLFSENVGEVSDQYARINVSIPMTPSSQKIFLYFKHAVDLEAVEKISQNEYFDGAVVEYSINNGVSWNDASNLIVDGKNVTGVIASVFSNPLSGRLAFSAISNGFVSTRLNLSSFSGQQISLRWRLGTDSTIAAPGWIIDDVSIYTCQGSINNLPTANAGTDSNATSGQTIILNGNSSSDADGAIASYSWEQIGGQIVTLNNASTVSPNFTATGGGGVLGFKLTVTDSDGLTDTDIVNIIINSPPNAIAGSDFSAVESSQVTLNGSSSFDPNGTIVSYKWTQVPGSSIVTLSDPTSASPSFNAPTPNQILQFSLSVTDNEGGVSSSDSVNVTITPKFKALENSGSGGGGGGGCSINPTASFNPFMFIVLLGLSIFHLRKRIRVTKKP